MAIHPSYPVAGKCQAVQGSLFLPGILVRRRKFQRAATHGRARQVPPALRGTGHAGTRQTSSGIVVACDQWGKRRSQMAMLAGAAPTPKNRTDDKDTLQDRKSVV